MSWGLALALSRLNAGAASFLYVIVVVNQPWLSLTRGFIPVGYTYYLNPRTSYSIHHDHAVRTDEYENSYVAGDRSGEKPQARNSFRGHNRGRGYAISNAGDVEFNNCVIPIDM